MNFGSKFAFHDSDDEEEQVREDAPSDGPLSAMSAGPAMAPVVPPLQQTFQQLEQQQQQQQQQQRLPGATQTFAHSSFFGSQRGGGLPLLTPTTTAVDPLPVPEPPRAGLRCPLGAPPMLRTLAGVTAPFGEADGAAAAPVAA